MTIVEEVERQSYLERGDAFALATALAEIGVYVRLEGSRQGWRLTLQGHTDLVDLGKVLDAFKVGEEKSLHALYRPFGGDSYPDVMIYAGSKP